MKKLVLLLIVLTLLLNTGIVFAETINYSEQYIYDIVMEADAKDRENIETHYRNRLYGEEILGVQYEYAPFSLILFETLEEFTKDRDCEESLNYDGLEFFIQHTREIVENTLEAKKYIDNNIDYNDPTGLVETKKPLTINGNVYFVNSYTTYGNIDVSEVLLECNNFDVYILYLGDLLDSNLLHKDISFNIIPTSYLEPASKDSTDRNTLIAVSGSGLQPADEIKAVIPTKPSTLNIFLNIIFYNVYTSTIFFFILFTIIGLIRKRISKNKKSKSEEIQ